MSLLNTSNIPEIKEVVSTEMLEGDNRKEIESPRGYMPRYLYKPPFGYPRTTPVYDLRRLANSAFVAMCIDTIIDEVTAIEWNIIPKKGIDINPELQTQVDHVTAFFENPNPDKESFEEILKQVIRDILEIDAGILEKTFDYNSTKPTLLSIRPRNGDTYTKNPDIHNTYNNRVEFMGDLGKEQGTDSKLPPLNFDPTQYVDTPYADNMVHQHTARNSAAYFQFGWNNGARPIGFGKKEVVWFERNPVSYEMYGISPVQKMMRTIQTLVYAIEHNLEQFTDNKIPMGIIGLEGANTDQIKAFKEQWNNVQWKMGEDGRPKKDWYKLPIVGKKPDYTRFQLSNAEMQLLESQKWWAHIVWAGFGVTPSELGFTEDSGNVTEIVQSRVFRRKAINPLLRLIEYRMNKEVVSEFDYPLIRFQYNMFDVDEEDRKADLYTKWIEKGIQTVNDIRVREGYDKVEWGDEAPQEFRNQGTEVNVNNERPEDLNQNADKKPLQERERDSEKKPVKKYKAQPVSPLIPVEGETVTSDDLEKAILLLIRNATEESIKLLESEFGQSKLSEIKSLSEVKGLKEIVDRIVGFFSLTSSKLTSDTMIEQGFNNGQEKAEVKVGFNFQPSKEALEFIQSYTFDNIIGMEADIKNKIRQVLERGLMEGQNLSELKKSIMSVSNVQEGRAEAIARTEHNRAISNGELTGMQTFQKETNRPVKKYWLIHEDDRTSDICMALDSKYGTEEKAIPLDENFEVNVGGKSIDVQTAPSHINCRSSVLYII